MALLSRPSLALEERCSFNPGIKFASMTRFRLGVQHYSVGLLLVAAFISGGLKSPFAFCAWALAALAWAILTVYTRLDDPKTIVYLVFFNTFVLMSQLHSVDPSNSLYWTTQSMVFSCLWLAMRTSPPFNNRSYFWHTLWGLGTLTVCIT